MHSWVHASRVQEAAELVQHSERSSGDVPGGMSDDRMQHTGQGHTGLAVVCSGLPQNGASRVSTAEGLWLCAHMPALNPYVRH